MRRIHTALLGILLMVPVPILASQVVHVVADLEIDKDGNVEYVEIFHPNLTQQMAAPIENTIKEWKFQAGIINGESVSRTTSIIVGITLNESSGGEKKIIAEKLVEGPRIHYQGNPKCLSELNSNGEKTVVSLSFKVTKDGKARNATIIESSNAANEKNECALVAIKDYVFIPEKFDGIPQETQMVLSIIF